MKRHLRFLLVALTLFIFLAMQSAFAFAEEMTEEDFGEDEEEEFFDEDDEEEEFFDEDDEDEDFDEDDEEDFDEDDEDEYFDEDEDEDFDEDDEDENFDDDDEDEDFDEDEEEEFFDEDEEEEFFDEDDEEEDFDEDDEEEFFDEDDDEEDFDEDDEEEFFDEDDEEEYFDEDEEEHFDEDEEEYFDEDDEDEDFDEDDEEEDFDEDEEEEDFDEDDEEEDFDEDDEDEYFDEDDEEEFFDEDDEDEYFDEDEEEEDFDEDDEEEDFDEDEEEEFFDEDEEEEDFDEDDEEEFFDEDDEEEFFDEDDEESWFDEEIAVSSDMPVLTDAAWAPKTLDYTTAAPKTGKAKSGASAKQGLIKKEPTAEPTGEADTTGEAEDEGGEEPDATDEDATGEDATGEEPTGEPEEPIAGEPGTEEDTEEAAPVYPTGKEVKAAAAATRKVTKGCNRIFGSNRYETSIKLAQELKKELGLSQFTSIILASGKNYPDALSGSYLAAQKAAPILLVANGVIDDAAAFIAKNLTQNGTVYILGGTASVPKAIEDSIEASRVIRLAGANRYETNLAILEEAGLDGRDLLVCSGLSYPDALSASATGKPILLTANSLLPEQRAYLNEYNDQIQNVYVVGGTGSVNTLVERQLANYGNVTRIAGDNRYETAKRVARKFYPEAREAILADGTNFPDSLAGGVLAWAKDAPLLLSANNMSFRTAYNYIVEKDILHRITLLGGPAVLPAGVAAMNPNGSRFINQMFYVAGVDLFAKGNSMLAQSEFVNWHGDRYYAGGNYAMKKNEIFKADGEFWEADEYGVISKPEGVRFSSPSVIEVSISQQHLWYYEDGELIFDCNVVTGNPWASDYQLRTPYGHSYINNKMTNGTLTGADYSVKVDYWMSFNYGSYYGFHDASWRSSFGGDIYTYDPSHGCVNLPYWAAQELYYHCYVGTDVYIT